MENVAFYRPTFGRYLRGLRMADGVSESLALLQQDDCLLKVTSQAHLLVPGKRLRIGREPRREACAAFCQHVSRYFPLPRLLLAGQPCFDILQQPLQLARNGAVHLQAIA